MNNITAHSFGPNAGLKAKGKGHPVMFGKMKPAAEFDVFPEGGGGVPVEIFTMGL